MNTSDPMPMQLPPMNAAERAARRDELRREIARLRRRLDGRVRTMWRLPAAALRATSAISDKSAWTWAANAGATVAATAAARWAAERFAKKGALGVAAALLNQYRRHRARKAGERTGEDESQS